MAGETGCIEWDGTRTRDGYGVLPKPVCGTRLAHRAALASRLGRPVQGVTRHTCDNPPCVNPLHLLEGTPADNVRDAVERGRIARGPRKSVCLRGHDVQVLGRKPSGGCIACQQEDSVAQAARRKAERHSRGLIRNRKETSNGK